MKKEIVVIIGYGSIGKRHAKILKKNTKISKIYLFTKQKVKNYDVIKFYSEIKKINPSLIIISSRTSNHYKDLNFILRNFKNKKILVEKPLFEKFKVLKVINKNRVFIGYNLRLHPVIQFLKNFLKKKFPFYVGIYCHSYLPEWRKKINYANSNSAKKKYGGGILLELSHELDYLQYLFKEIQNISSVNIGKFSKLKTDAEDTAIITGETKKVKFVIDLNYFSRNTQRLIIVNYPDFTMKCDLFNYKVEIIKNKKKKIIKFNNDINQTYKLEHDLIFKNNTKKLCDFNQGLEVLKIIDKIKNFNR